MRYRRPRLVLTLAIVTSLMIVHQWTTFLKWIDESDFKIPDYVLDSLYQTDPDLIHHIKKNVLIQPSNKPYNLTHPDNLQFSLRGEEEILEALFNNKTHGVFFEAGALDGEKLSNTLYLEKYFSWTGLLVEPMPRQVEKMKNKHRKSWLAPVCLSGHTHSEKVKFLEAAELSRQLNTMEVKNDKIIQCPHGYAAVKLKDHINLDYLLSYSKCKYVVEEVEVNCYPVYSLLMAAGFTHVDFFSLDIEAAEVPVLQTLIFHNLNIEVFYIELDKLKNEVDVTKVMNKLGYVRKETLGEFNLLKELERDGIFVKKDSHYMKL